MEYPFWYIPGLSKGTIMALMAVLHVFVAQFAVGGGIYLAWMERMGHKHQSPALLEWLERHTRFFLLLTMVFGGLSGVGIWFTMSVINPAATSALIHTFLFVWATEWTFFLVEIIALLVYFYTYPLCRKGLFSPATHWRIGVLYAFAAVMSLVLIGGVVSFMLTPGDAFATGSLYDAFFNPSFLSSVVYRIALSCMLAGMFALFTASRIEQQPTRRMVVKASALWICIPFFVLLLATLWYYGVLPADRQAAIMRRTMDMRPFIIGYGWILPLIFLAGVFAYVRAERLRRPLTILVLCAGLVLVGSFEWIREAGRRPWIIPGHMYSNGVSLDEAAVAVDQGIAHVSGWVRLLEQEGTGQSRFTPGAAIFSQQCGTCHAVNGARLDIVPRLERYAPHGLVSQISGQGSRLEYMPPFFGNAADRHALAAYLERLRQRAE